MGEKVQQFKHGYMFKNLRFFSLRNHLIMAKWHATPCRNKIEARKKGEVRMILWLNSSMEQKSSDALAGRDFLFSM